jgi:hypothetical protein
LEGIVMKYTALVTLVFSCGIFLVQPVHAELKSSRDAASPVPKQQQTKPQMQPLKPKAHASSKPGRPGEELGMEKADEEERPSPAQLKRGPAKPQMNVMPARGGKMIIDDNKPAGQVPPETQLPAVQQQQQSHGFGMPGSEVGMEKADEPEMPNPAGQQQQQGFVNPAATKGFNPQPEPPAGPDQAIQNQQQQQ